MLRRDGNNFRSMRKYCWGISVRSVVSAEFVRMALDLYICSIWQETLVMGKAECSFAEVPSRYVLYP